MTTQVNSDPTVRLEVALGLADKTLTRIARSDDPVLSALVDPLYRAVSDEADRLAAKFDGCFDFWPDAKPMPLSEPAVLGSTDGNLLSVLIPGTPDVISAITTAVDVAREGGADLDPTDPNLYAEVHPARWMVLNRCESNTHDFHPELAVHGERTPGAVLVTRVDLT